jgi:hypothetical protein
MPGSINHSFVVRIWIEPREYPKAPVEWRGMIQDVISGQSKYFRELDEMVAFIVLQISQDIQNTKGFEQ